VLGWLLPFSTPLDLGGFTPCRALLHLLPHLSPGSALIAPIQTSPAPGRGLAGSARDDRASMQAQLLSTVVQGPISGSSTSEARAAEHARVLAAVGKQVDSTPPRLSRSERFNIRSAERERAASAEKAARLLAIVAGSALPPVLNEAIMIGNAHSLATMPP
jgi:hypothetical protein